MFLGSIELRRASRRFSALQGFQTFVAVSPHPLADSAARDRKNASSFGLQVTLTDKLDSFESAPLQSRDGALGLFHDLFVGKEDT